MANSGFSRSTGIIWRMVVAFTVLLMPRESVAQRADLALINGKIVTVDESIPEAEALYIRGDRIAAVGSSEQIKTHIGPETKVIDLGGKLAVPGLIDGHAHLMNMGRFVLRLNLKVTRSWEEILTMVRDRVAHSQPGEWILGRGWHQEEWREVPSPNVDGLPYHHALTEIAPDNPVYLQHTSGHACIANARAMALAGITPDTPDPAGGEIVRDADGTPIGVFRETADSVVYAAYEAYLTTLSPEQMESLDRRIIELGCREFLANGITTVCDAGSEFDKIDLFCKLADEGNLPLRLWVMVSSEVSCEELEARLSEYRIIETADHHLTVRAIKRAIDGALGSHGAWLLEPYADLPTSTGLNTTSIEDMKETARIAMDHGYQLCTHAIGDRANRETLDIYEAALRSRPDQTDLRWRIEHAQHLHPDDIARFGQLGVIASMQAIHCTSDGPWVPKRIGEQRSREGAYVWRKLIDSGARVTNGTDAPVEAIDPLANFHASITRRLPDGTRFYPEQCMTRAEALRAYTIDNAYAAFEEDLKGSIRVGKLADITVLSKDILTIPEEQILETEVVCTIVGGEVMYEAADRR
jgi:predicted amidohydrolase YtcJ